MLNIYARTFMIATMTDLQEAGGERNRWRPRLSGHRQKGWLRGAWRRLAGREQ